jgi:hypothetical protein
MSCMPRARLIIVGAVFCDSCDQVVSMLLEVECLNL